MSEYKLPADASRLGLRHRDATALHVDWEQIRAANEYEDVVVQPKPTADVLEEYGYDGGQDLTTEEGLAAAIEEFEGTRGHDEWRDRNQPMMNYVWPCEMPYGTGKEKAAQLIAEHGGSTCLVSCQIGGEDFVGIALTGGGMNLAHDIAAAYVCCGHVPPLAVLDDALSQIKEMSEPVRPLVVEAATRTVESLRWTADSLEQRVERSRNEIAPPDAGDAPASGPQA
jgi:hypothetical protein